MKKIPFATLALCLTLTSCSKAEEPAKAQPEETKPKAAETKTEAPLATSIEDIDTLVARWETWKKSIGENPAKSVNAPDKAQKAFEQFGNEVAGMGERLGGEKGLAFRAFAYEVQSAAVHLHGIYIMAQMNLWNKEDKSANGLNAFAIVPYYADFLGAAQNLDASSAAILDVEKDPRFQAFVKDFRGMLDITRNIMWEHGKTLHPDLFKFLVEKRGLKKPQ